MVKNPPANTRDVTDMGSTPGWGRFAGGEHVNTLQYYCLENPMDRVAWQVTASDMTEATIHTNTESNLVFSSVQSLSCVQLFATPWTAARQASLSITNCRSPPKPMSIESVMPSNHLILCRPLLLLPSIFPRVRVFSNESALRIRWPKYWSFSFNISPFNEYSRLISFRMDWLDLFAVQGTLKSLSQHHSSKAPIIRHSAFFI